MANAGSFQIKVATGYPAWCEIFYDGERLVSIHHKEMSDLEYVVKKAIQEARTVLGSDRDEV